MAHLLLFEGAELVGKSYLIAQVYAELERRSHTEEHILDGCHWFNCDVGVFGTKHGRLCIENYVKIAEGMADKNVLFEKFHYTDAVYHAIYKNEKIDYTDIERRLAVRGAKLIFCTVEPREDLFAKRLTDRLNLYPHYKRIAQKPADYIRQQETYKEVIAQSTLPTLTIDTTAILDPSLPKKILNWI